MGTSLFSRGTAVDRVGDGRFVAELDAHWNCPIVPQGGILVATAARAMEATVADPGLPLRTLSGLFAARVADGPVDIEVCVLRRGRSMTQVRASMRNPGAPAGFDVLAVFGADRAGFTFTDTAPPDGLPAPLACPSFRDAAPEGVDDGPPPPFWEQVEGRPALGHAPWDDYEPDSSLRAYWYRFDDPPRADDGTWDPYAVVALCDTMPGAVGERLGPEGRGRGWWAPSVDFTVHVFGTARSEWLLAVNRARYAGGGYASADIEMWDVDSGDPTLVAYATQTMFFTFPDA